MTYKNTPVNYTDTGSGNAVVLLHGFLENLSMWQDLTQSLSQEYRVIAVDLLGHGGTGCIGYVHTMEEQAELLHALLLELRVAKAVITGHSMGGYVALAFAELYPEMVGGVALVNSTSRPDSEERRKNRDRAIVAVKENYTNFVRLSIANLFSEANRERLSAAIEAVKQQALKTPLQGIIASLEGMKIRKDREQLLKNAPYPIVLFLGKKDSVLAYEENADQVEHTTIPLVTFADGHMSPIENREELHLAMKDFLGKI